PGDRPSRGLIAPLTGALRQGVPHEGRELLGPKARVVAATLVEQAFRVLGLGLTRRPVVDTHPADAQQAGDRADGSPSGYLQDGQGTAEDGGVAGGLPLPFQEGSLRRGKL